jgi:hypothetical protein
VDGKPPTSAFREAVDLPGAAVSTDSYVPLGSLTTRFCVASIIVLLPRFPSQSASGAYECLPSPSVFGCRAARPLVRLSGAPWSLSQVELDPICQSPHAYHSAFFCRPPAKLQPRLLLDGGILPSVSRVPKRAAVRMDTDAG